MLLVWGAFHSAQISLYIRESTQERDPIYALLMYIREFMVSVNLFIQELLNSKSLDHQIWYATYHN